MWNIQKKIRAPPDLEDNPENPLGHFKTKKYLANHPKWAIFCALFDIIVPLSYDFAFFFSYVPVANEFRYAHTK